MSTGIDYSKWDKMVAEMSSSDDEGNNQQFIETDTNNDVVHDNELSSKHANVTRLKNPSSVTIGPQGLTINPTTTNSTKASMQNDASSSNSNIPSLLQTQHNLSSLLKKWSRNGGIHNFDYLWCQTADELVIRFLIPVTARSKHVKIGFNANKKHFSCNITTNGNEWLLNKTFSRKLKESTEEEAKLDWELCNVQIFNFEKNTLQETMKEILCVEEEKNNNAFIEYANRLSNCRFLKISLEKERINNRVIEWWDNVFVGDTKIDLKQRIEDRKTDANKMNDIWKKAHQQFKEKVANIQPQEIYVPDDD